ncbi:hypothetical protein FSP39_018803 [Pinctada imbricata]|uniref:Protein NO VEIN C-terminal domain-containing protein n=1 Tax=Pinctada imbricata TaxID=66713 RepID=A0AA88XZV3_PINIB|nr:hypothetical protein FSP39_018803 [Pinctada imbricata]
MRIRSVCTLYELKECITEFAPDKKDFNQLHIGPVQCLPVVYKYFKFPTDMAEVPEITTVDILENLKHYLDKFNKWTDRLDLEDFLNYMVKEYNVENAYILGVRIRSLPLAAQVLKKSQRDMSANRRGIMEAMREELRKDVEQIFVKFRVAITQTGRDGQPEVRQHYLRLRPEVALQEIFDKYQLLLTSIEPPTTKAARRKAQRMMEAITNFIIVSREDPMCLRLFHLAICISNTELEEATMELLAPSPAETSVTEATPQKQPPAKALVCDHLKKYLDKCISAGKLTLKMFDQIEEKICEDFDFPNFIAMGFGRFLEFMLKEAKQTLDDCGGTSLGGGSGHHDNDGIYMPTHTDILEFIHQCKQCGIKQPQDLEKVICEQFAVKEVKRLGHGNISRLVTSADKPGKHQNAEHTVVYGAAICGNKGTQVLGSQTGMLGHQTREAALTCLHNCPLLEDMGAWSQWSQVFEPQLGKLKDFVQKYGGVHTSNVQGGKRIMTTDIVALEVRPGHLVKLVSQTSVEKFHAALSSGHINNVCGHIVSMVVSNKGVENTPLALLANHVKSALLTLHAEGSSQNTPGAPPDPVGSPDRAVLFVLECLTVLPASIASVLASQIFLDPLGQVVGSTKSKSLLLSTCRTVYERNCLQRLGCTLGISEWTNQIQEKCRPPEESVEEVPQEEAEEFFQDVEEIEDSDDDDDNEDDTSSSTSFLSDNEEETTNTKDESMAVVDEAPISDDEMRDLSKEKGDGEKEEDGDTEEKEDGEDSPKDPEEVDEEEENLTEEEKVERECRKLVEEIRRDEFGIGVELNEDGKRLMVVQHERLGRSLDRLSKDLYSKDTHFVLELVQNADDNNYADDLLADDSEECPSVKFIMTNDGVIVLNNEKGFEEKNVRALCDVGRSTKGKHKAGYIGQKGIGFKSVFRVTDSPEVHSHGYHINFDVKSGPTGYILPHWIEDRWNVEEGWTTKIVLPLKEEMRVQLRSLAARFNDIHPSLLLFLHRLQQITVENQVESSVQAMRKRNLGKGVVEISHNDGKDRWLVVKKMLDASQISLQAKSGVEVESTEIALAFPLRPSGQKSLTSYLPPKQPVFAFLPLRTYGFRFIIQGDFDVPSSREDVDKDSPWNQWIRNEIHMLFIEALEDFKNHPDFKMIEAVTTYLQFVPVEDEILDFFRPVAAQILKKLKAKACVPTQPNSKGTSTWKIPSQTVTVHDPLVLEVVTPELLKSTLNLHYLHRDVAAILNPSLTQSLGIECLTTDHLMLIGKSFVSAWEKGEGPSLDEQILMTSKWLACIYRSLDEFQDNQVLYDKLKELKIIFLASHHRVALTESTVFFPLSEDSKPARNDPMNILQQDLNTIHPLLVNTPDNEVNSQVQKLLLKIGVCQLSPKEVICQHILPVLKSEAHKEKKREILISYVIYIKEQLEQQISLVNIDELAAVALVMTNQGMVNAKDVPVHFTQNYGNKLDLGKLPGYNWTLLDAVYLRNVTSHIEVQRWREFFLKLGITDTLAIRNKRVPLSDQLIKSSPWEPIADSLRPFSEGCYIDDWSCDEVHQLITENTHKESYPHQLRYLYGILEKDWDGIFSRYRTANFCDKDGRKIKEVDTSFSIHLKTLPWIPAISTSSFMVEESQTIHWVEKLEIMQPSCLYLKFQEMMNLLGHTVMYVDVNVSCDKEFGKFLGFKYGVSKSEIMQFLIKWGERKDKPAIFCTTLKHIRFVYEYIQQNFSQKEIQDLFLENSIIFVPLEAKLSISYSSPEGNYPSRAPSSIVAGQMLNRSEVWWCDPTGLFRRHRKIILEFHAEIGKKWLLEDIYRDSDQIQDLFVRGGRIEPEPKVTEYGELLVLMGQVTSLSEKSVLSDALHLYVYIGSKVTVDTLGSEQQTASFLINADKKALRNLFKGQKIIVTKRDQWASLEERPLIPDRKELEKMFQNHKGVHFIQTEEKLQRGPRRGIATRREQSLINEESLQPFLELCQIQKLSESIHVEHITPMFEPCAKLQYYVHLATPLVQIYLWTNYPDIYQKQKDDDIIQRLHVLQCVQTGELNVKYSLFDRDSDITVLQEEKCIQENNLIMFHRNYVELYGEINKELARFFASNDKDCTVHLKSFLTDLTPILNGETRETPEQILQLHDCDTLPEDEPIWHIEPPIMPVFAPPEPEIEPEPEYEEQPIENVTDAAAPPGGDQEEKTGPEMKSWPPMSDTTGTVRQKGLPREPRSEDKSKESKVWPPPKAPDYVQSTKHLSSQFKVVSEEGDTDEGQQNAGQGTDKEHIRHEGDGKGTKRKISEETQLSDLENKRASLPSGGQGYERRDKSVGDSEEPFDNTQQSVSRGDYVPKEGDQRQNAVQEYDGHGFSDGAYGASDGTQRQHSQTTDERATSSGHYGRGESGEHTYDDENYETSLERDGKPGYHGKRRHPTRDSDSPPSPKKSALLMDDPIWGEFASEYVFEELGSGAALKVPPSHITLGQGSEKPEIGRWGEYLDDETGNPYDFEVIVEGEEGTEVIYIEVKSTLSDKKDLFEISAQQVDFARQVKERFHIYRVFNAGDMETVRLVRIDNLSLCMDKKQVKLCMLI